MIICDYTNSLQKNFTQNVMEWIFYQKKYKYLFSHFYQIYINTALFYSISPHFSLPNSTYIS